MNHKENVTVKFKEFNLELEFEIPAEHLKSDSARAGWIHSQVTAMCMMRVGRQVTDWLMSHTPGLEGFTKPWSDEGTMIAGIELKPKDEATDT